MASRMERYYKNEEITTGRSNKNKSLYEQIQDLDGYTNIEAVATIENNNEIDISRVKKMINNRENYKKERELRGILKEEEIKEEEKVEEPEEEKNYDINDVLRQLKKDNIEGQEAYRKLDEDIENRLKDLSRKTKNYNTIQDTKEELEEIKEEDDDVGLFDDLKSDTVVGDAASIKKILDEEKEYNKTKDLDTSMYNTNFGLTKKDFEDLKDLNKKVTRTNNGILIFLIILTIVIIIAFSIIIFM